MKPNDIITLVEVYARFNNLSEATVSNQATTHARLFSRLRAGHSCTLATYERVVSWFADNWPDDLEWPSGIDRPIPGGVR